MNCRCGRQANTAFGGHRWCCMQCPRSSTHTIWCSRRADKSKGRGLMLSQKLRNRVCHGWAFRVHTEEETEAIKHYLETGDVEESFPYKAVDQATKEGRGGK